jgi:hypothetical protein
VEFDRYYGTGQENDWLRSLCRVWMTGEFQAIAPGRMVEPGSCVRYAGVFRRSTLRHHRGRRQAGSRKRTAGLTGGSCATREKPWGLAPAPSPGHRGEDKTPPGPPKFACVRRWTLTVIALVSLLSFALLASALAHGHGLDRFERPLLRSLGSPSSAAVWADFADLLAAPAIIAVLVVALAFGALRRSLVRVAVYAGFAAVALLINEQVAKPLVHETYNGQLTFPSGNVTAVCATALALWLALHPLLGRWARSVTFLVGAAWVLLMSLAVVGAQWHTSFDALGSVLLSLGIVTGGAAIFAPGVAQEPTSDVGGELVGVGGRG